MPPFNTAKQRKYYKAYGGKPQNCSILWDNNVGAYQLKMDYDEDFIALIKGLIPAGKRDYDPKLQVWWVNEEYFAPLKTVAENVYVQVNVFEKPPKEFYEGFAKAIPTGPADIDRFAKLVELDLDKAQALSLSEATKLYRIYARKYHPDLNSANYDKMSDLNEVWARLKVEYFK